MASKELANVLVNRYGYRKPNKLETMAIFKLISAKVFGDVQHTINKDGGVTFNYDDVGSATKYFIGNSIYFNKVKHDFASKIKNKITDKFKSLFNEDLNEARRTPYKENTYEEIIRLINGIGYEKLFISFRETNNVSIVNKNNKYNTPTGFYCYPLKSYQTCIQNKEDIKGFTNCFPFQQNLEFIHVFSLEDSSHVLKSSNPDINFINKCVITIEERYKDNEIIIGYCQGFKDKTFDSYSSDSETFVVRNNNEVSRLWLLLYAVSDLIKKSKLAHTVSILASSLGINGFVDDACISYIHSGEPCQAVFFVGNFRKIVGNYRVFSSHRDRGDVQLNIDSDKNNNNNNGDYEFSVSKFLSFINKRYNINNAHAVDSSYSQFMKNISKNVPNPILINNTPYFINQKGEISIERVNFDHIQNEPDNTLLILAYFNSMYKDEKFSQLVDFISNGTYIIKNSENLDVLVDKNGKININDFKLDIDKLKSYDSNYLRMYINGKNNNITKFGIIKNLGVFDSNNQIIGYDKFDKPHLFDVDANEIKKENAVIDLNDSIIDYNDQISNYINFIVGERKFSSVTYFNIRDEYAKAYLYNNNKSVFINKLGEIVDLDLNKNEMNNLLSTIQRSDYINKKIGSNMFDQVSRFEKGENDLALCRLLSKYPYVYYFIDEKGKITNDGINVNDNFENKLAAYFNSIENNLNEYTNATPLNSFVRGEHLYGFDVVADNIDDFDNKFVVSEDEAKKIINSDGSNFNIEFKDEYFTNYHVSALAFNTKIGKTKYKYLFKSFKDENIFLGITIANYPVFIDINDNYNFGTITIDDLNDYNQIENISLYGAEGQNVSAYFNSLFKTIVFGRFSLYYDSYKKGYKLITKDDDWLIYDPETKKLTDYETGEPTSINNLKTSKDEPVED